MILQQVTQLIHQERNNDKTVAELDEALSTGNVRSLSEEAGCGTAHVIARDFKLRLRAITDSGHTALGLQKLLNSLACRPNDTEILLFHFKDNRGLYSVFIEAKTEKLVGVVRVISARRDPPG